MTTLSGPISRAGDGDRTDRDEPVLAGPFLVDAHVHVYPCFRIEDVLSGALANTRRLAGATAVPWLLLSEVAGTDVFAALAAGGPGGGWRVVPLGDPVTVQLYRGEDRVLVSAGRQLQTAEGLEIQALGCAAPLPDGLTLHDALRRIRAAGGLPVVPWGFGKWWFGRGRALAAFLADADASTVMLADSGQRLGVTPVPAALRAARRDGRPVLAGTDPFPIPAEAARVGSFGLLVPGPVSAAGAFADLARTLYRRTEYREVGDHQSPGRFMLNQIVMQARKRGLSSP